MNQVAETEHQKRLSDLNKATIIPCACGDLADSVMTLQHYDSKSLSARAVFSIHDYYNPRFFKHYEDASWRYGAKLFFLSLWVAITSAEMIPYKLSIIVESEDEKERLSETMKEFGINVEYEGDQVQEKYMKDGPTDYSVKNIFYKKNGLSFWDRVMLIKEGMVFKTLDGYKDGEGVIISVV